MPELELLDDERSVRGVNSRVRGLNRLLMEEPPSAAATKELFAETRVLTWGGHLVANMPRAVITTVRQSRLPVVDINAGQFSDLVDLVIERFSNAEEQKSTIRPAAIQGQIRSIARRLIKSFRVAEAHGQAAEFESRLGAWLAANTDCPVETAPFLEQAKQLEKRGRTDTALDLVYDQIDERLLAGRFTEVDQLLATVSVADLSLDLLLALLTATLPARNQLANRARFFAAIEETLRQREEYDDGLLIGLN